MDPLFYSLLFALLGINLGWLLFLSVQIGRGLEALRQHTDSRAALAKHRQAHAEVLQRRNLEAVAQFEASALTAIRELWSPDSASI